MRRFLGPFLMIAVTVGAAYGVLRYTGADMSQVLVFANTAPAAAAGDLATSVSGDAAPQGAMIRAIMSTAGSVLASVTGAPVEGASDSAGLGPESQTAAEASAEDQAEPLPVVRRGTEGGLSTSCSLVDGVRRCRVGG